YGRFRSTHDSSHGGHERRGTTVCHVRSAMIRPSVLRKTIDLAENFSVRPPEARVLLDVRPPDDAVAIDQEVCAVREERVLEEHAVGARRLALEVAQQIDLHSILRLEL